MTIERRSAPIITLSFAFSKSSIWTNFLLSRAANNAASLTRFAKSAPEKPGVPRASTLDFTSSLMATLPYALLKFVHVHGYRAKEPRLVYQNDLDEVMQDLRHQDGW